LFSLSYWDSAPWFVCSQYGTLDWGEGLGYVLLSAWKPCTDKKESQIFLIYKEIQSGAFSKSYMRKGFLIYEEMRKYFPIYEEAVSHI
jgi:hypothetical protein